MCVVFDQIYNLQHVDPNIERPDSVTGVPIQKARSISDILYLQRWKYHGMKPTEIIAG